MLCLEIHVRCLTLEQSIAKYEDYLKDNPVMPFCHQSCFVLTTLMQNYKFDMSYRIVAITTCFIGYIQMGLSINTLMRSLLLITASMEFLLQIRFCLERKDCASIM